MAARKVGVALDADDLFARETERAGILAEFDFVTSLIPLYRRFEMQALRLAILILAATGGFIASALEMQNRDAVLFALALVPTLLGAILITIAGMEARIIRASRYVDRTLRPRLRDMARQDVWVWEKEPCAHLNATQRRFVGTFVYAIPLLLPGLAAGAVACVAATEHYSGLKTVVAGVGLFGLTAAGITVRNLSSRHERRADDEEPLWRRHLSRLGRAFFGAARHRRVGQPVADPTSSTQER